MKKIVTLLLTFIICISLGACGGNNEPEETPEDIVSSACEADISVRCIMSYKDVKYPSVDIYTVRQDGANTYVCQGKVTIMDNYGDKYVGKFTAEYKYDEQTKTATNEELDIENPTKQR